ncbi:hypothetical protein HYV81_06290 [Candidatus Woesearchaeota archaeon]|nr:hypothetical protein [Candidatus Woesearchaeota archaeon]
MSPTKFWIGVVLFVANFVLGFFAKFLILFEGWRIAALVIYGVSWFMLFIGIILVGKEGWDYIVQRYRDYRKRTVKNIKRHSAKTYHKVRRHSKRAYSKLKEGVKKQMPGSKRA